MGKQRYDVKRGHFENIEGEKLKELMDETFHEVKEEEEKLIVDKDGAISHLEVWTEGRTGLWIDLEMNKDVGDDVAMETISKWNDFLEEATGFTAKERKKRAKKNAKEEG
ncbi:MAG: DUF5611 family protein [Candidatus Thermoplasmatota archaeon]|nr:DUF5611 family protein [Candidatus Thermoplasmatota archaeon]